jgi:hypothetical protein
LARRGRRRPRSRSGASRTILCHQVLRYLRR